ncbi:serine/threonine-protein kinase pim-2-like [Puntigrus tetrazona]|uniref:serine/threonine-protein kinase pim-2-like n=1 Tax=Puntigrus tetrazona TaxID=1606681 RepID=UPI001C89405B|nr:serine/threonine-protein kinase pim-2-like [Puntigrus tetrazona]
MSDSVSIKETADKKPVKATTRDSGSASSDNAGPVKVCPSNDVENSPTEKPAKGKKMKGACAVFRRVWKAVKRPFFCCDPNRVVNITPQPDQDDSELTPVPSPPRIAPTANADPEPMCLPGQVCEDVCEESSCVPGPSRSEQIPDVEMANSESSPVADPSCSDLGDEKLKKWRKGKAVRAFFRRFRKAVKHLLLCRDSKIVRSSTPQVDPDSDEDLADCAISFESEPSCQTGSDQASEALQSPPPVQEASRAPVFLLGDFLGRGSYGKVYEATYLVGDKTTVAVKYIRKRQSDHYLHLAGHSKPVLAEVAMLLRLGKPPLCPNVIKFHEWTEEKNSAVLIMEYPKPCCTLNEYIKRSKPINEEKACLLIRQLIQALKHCVDRRVFHGDIHTGNILVTPTTLELKLIDFGCAQLIHRGGNLSSQYRGATLCTPPEVMRDSTFHAGPAYVWAVGMMLFQILHGYLPFKSKDKILCNCTPVIRTLSSDLVCEDVESSGVTTMV